MKEKDVKMYMDIAERVSQRSYATRLKVGCVIEKDGSIISFGWNGMPAGYDNCCEHTDENGNLVTNREVQHAELNAIGKAAKAGISVANANLFITHSPCINCSLIILISGIKSVYYKSEYRDTYGIDFLRKNGVHVEKVSVESRLSYMIPDEYATAYESRLCHIANIQKLEQSDAVKETLKSSIFELGAFLMSIIKKQPHS